MPLIILMLKLSHLPLNIVKIAVLPPSNLQISVIPAKIPIAFFAEMEKLEVHMKLQGVLNSQS